MDVSGRQGFVSFAAEREMSRRDACELVKVSRRRLGSMSRKAVGDAEVVARLKDLAAAYPSYGVRLLWAKLRQAGRLVKGTIRDIAAIHDGIWSFVRKAGSD